MVDHEKLPQTHTHTHLLDIERLIVIEIDHNEKCTQHKKNGLRSFERKKNPGQLFSVMDWGRGFFSLQSVAGEFTK